MRPCVPRRECYFDAEQFWLGNRAGFRWRYRRDSKSDEELRAIAYAEHADIVAEGKIPPLCAKCGLHHKVKD